MHSSQQADPANKQEIPETLGGWEIYQHRPFLEIVARHYRIGIIERAGVLMLARNYPILGALSARLNGPEASGHPEWQTLIGQGDCGSIDVLTNRPITNGRAQLDSPPDLTTLLVDLRDGEQPTFNRMQSRCRKAVRHAQRGGLEIRQGTSDTDLAAFHARLLDVIRGGKVFPAPPIELLGQILAGGFGELHLAVLRGEVVGGGFVLRHRYAHGLALCLDPKIADGLSSNLLYWEAIRSAAAQGLPFFDLGTHSLSELPQLTMAKRAFSPLMVPAYRYTVTERRWRKALTRGAGRLKAASSLLRRSNGDGLLPGR